MTQPPPFPRVPLRPYVPGEPPETLARRFHDTLALRRTVRDFSSRPVSLETVQWIVRAAGTAPSGANKQPWRFVAVADPALKRRIRLAAEEEEREFYTRRATPQWLADLAPLGTDASKPFLETAPWLIVVFKLVKTDDDGLTYYTNESVGIAVGMLLAAAHSAGLATLTHTPSPMGFLSHVLGRPAHERPYLLIPLGYPADDATVPDITRKPLDDILVVHGTP
jgi:nitroreductase